MKVEIKSIVLVGVAAEANAQAVVVQKRETDMRNRVTKEGAVLLVVQAEDGRQCQALLSPDEGHNLFVQGLVACAQAANALAPVMTPVHEAKVTQ